MSASWKCHIVSDPPAEPQDRSGDADTTCGFLVLEAALFSLAIGCTVLWSLASGPERHALRAISLFGWLVALALAALRAIADVRRRRLGPGTVVLGLAATALLAYAFLAHGCGVRDLVRFRTGRLWADEDVTCRQNLERLATALALYRKDEGTWPTTGQRGDALGSLSLLFPTYVFYPETFVCPMDPGAKARIAGSRLDQPLTARECSYVYDNAAPQDASRDHMLLWDRRPGPHAGGRHVLFADGRVEWLSEARFQQRLAKRGPGR